MTAHSSRRKRQRPLVLHWVELRQWASLATMHRPFWASHSPLSMQKRLPWQSVLLAAMHLPSAKLQSPWRAQPSLFRQAPASSCWQAVTATNPTRRSATRAQDTRPNMGRVGEEERGVCVVINFHRLLCFHRSQGSRIDRRHNWFVLLGSLDNLRHSCRGFPGRRQRIRLFERCNDLVWCRLRFGRSHRWRPPGKSLLRCPRSTSLLSGKWRCSLLWFWRCTACLHVCIVLCLCSLVSLCRFLGRRWFRRTRRGRCCSLCSLRQWCTSFCSSRLGYEFPRTFHLRRSISSLDDRRRSHGSRHRS